MQRISAYSLRPAHQLGSDSIAATTAWMQDARAESPSCSLVAAKPWEALQRRAFQR